MPEPRIVLARDTGADGFAAGFEAAGFDAVVADDFNGASVNGRVVLWGRTGAVFAAAAADPSIAAVIALAPELPTIRTARDPGALRHLVGRPARKLGMPVLVQVADEDLSAQPAMKAAWDAQALVRHYPVDRAGILPGGRFYDRALQHAVDFLKRSV